MTNLTIHLRTLTPLWTGGVDQSPDRLHETGLIGSLRWWYEALVRGLGGYACDPTSEQPQARCEFDTKAYEQAKKEGKTDAEAINAALHNVCPVCYLFGTTGWARLFQLRATDMPTTRLHFRTTLKMNAGWLKKVFGGESQNIDSLPVSYGNIKLQFIPRRQDAEYAKIQFALILKIAAEYGGVGARIQHGFGQFMFPDELKNVTLASGLQQLKGKINSGALRSSGSPINTPFSLHNFLSLAFEIPKQALSVFMHEKAHVGSADKRSETRYIPCVFDLRYRGQGKWGMRQWLKQQGWRETSNPKHLEELDLLLGPRSQWGIGQKQGQIDDDFRTASRIFFGMPYQKPANKDSYVLRVWAFWPPELSNRLNDVQALKNLLEEYIKHAFGSQARKLSETLGQDILERAVGGIR